MKYIAIIATYLLATLTASAHGISEADKAGIQAIQKQQGKLASVVEKKDLGEAHDHAFAIRDLVKALPVKVPAENKAKAEAGAKEITKIAADIDKSGAAGAQKATEANVNKMDEAITALKTQLKAK